VAMRLSSMSPLFAFELEPLRQNADFILYWGKQHDKTPPVLVPALAAEPPSPQNIKCVSISRLLHFRIETASAHAFRRHPALEFERCNTPPTVHKATT
jgi:hypothetical protein